MEAAWALRALSIGLFSVALFTGTFRLETPVPADATSWNSGLAVLAVGWITVFQGVPAWLANPLVLVAWLALARHPRLAAAAAVAAMVCSLSFLLQKTIIGNENGTAYRITQLEPGYWLWVASTVLAVAAAAMRLRQAKSEAPRSAAPDPNAD